MAKADIYNQEGKIIGDVQLSDSVFGVQPDAGLVHHVLIAQQANARRVIASTKTRGEVRGGGKKPWRQKGTGRARQGSIRSPQWVGGGITFGPRPERSFEVKINKKVKQKALFMALSDKLLSKKLIILDKIETTPTKTKLLYGILKCLPLSRSVLIIASMSSPLLMRMVRNLSNVKLITAQSVNLIDLLSHQSVIFMQNAVLVFEKLYV